MLETELGIHPSQALLDLITIKQEFGEIKDLKNRNRRRYQTQ